MSRMKLTTEMKELINELWPSHTPKEVAAIIGPQYYSAMVSHAFHCGLKHNEETLKRIRQIHGSYVKNGNTPEACRKRSATIKRKMQEKKLKQRQLWENLKTKLNIK